MRLLVVVPSRSRGEILYKNAYRWLKNANCDYKVFVEAHQQSQYSFVDNDNLVLLQKQRQGLGYALQQARAFAAERNYDCIFKIDDDVRRFTMRYLHQPKNDSEKTQLRIDVFNKVLEDCQNVMMMNSRIGAIGFPYRNEQHEASTYKVNKKLQTAYIVRLNVYNPEPAFSAQEDYMAYINVRKNGLDVLRLDRYAIDLAIPVGGGKGGIGDFDRAKLAKEEMELIKSRHPNIVFKHKPDTSWKWEVDFSKSKF